jgi:prevent-host-death family protein
MRTLQLAEAKNNFSAVLKDVKLGNEIVISYGNRREALAVIIPYEKWKKSRKRELGTLEGRGSVEFADDWYMTNEELCHS